MASFERRTRRLEQFQRIERRFQDRTNPLEVFSRDEVKVRYRFYPESIILLLHSIFGQLEAATARSMPLPPMLMLLVSLQFYATGSHFLVVGDIHGVSKSSVSRAVWKTTRAIASLCQTYIKMPEGEEIDQRKKEFFNIARFPQIVGAIDGTQIPIKGPSVNEPDYVNRKGVHSINVQVEQQAPDDFIWFRGHQLSVTCAVISPDSQQVYSAGKDCSINKWSIKERRKVHTVACGRKGTEERHIGHTDHVIAMALTSDDKYLATGDKNKLILLWDAATMQLLHTFRGHRDVVSGLTFRKDSHLLFSCSTDRSVKIWNVDERAYVETLSTRAFLETLSTAHFPETLPTAHVAIYQLNTQHSMASNRRI